MQTASRLVAGLAGELGTGMKLGKDDLNGRNTGCMPAGRHASAFVFNTYYVILLDGDPDDLAKAVESLVHRIIHYFPY